MTELCKYETIFSNDEWELVNIVPLNGSDGGKIKKNGFQPILIPKKEENIPMPTIVTRPTSSTVLEGLGNLLMLNESNMISVRKV